MAVLVIDDKSKATIAALIEYAMQHRQSTAVLEKIMAGQAQPPGDNPNFTCIVPVQYRVVFTIEQQPDGNWYRHLSISRPQQYPHPLAIEMLLKEFGFQKQIKLIVNGLMKKIGPLTYSKDWRNNGTTTTLAGGLWRMPRVPRPVQLSQRTGKPQV